MGRGLQSPARGLCLTAAVLLAIRSACADYTVTTTADNGDNTNPTTGSLRWAIEQANANLGGTVDIPAGLGTITLTGQMPILSQAMTINGNGNTINGNNLYRIFFIDAANESTPFIINNLTLANGCAHGGNGGDGGGGGMGQGPESFLAWATFQSLK